MITRGCLKNISEVQVLTILNVYSGIFQHENNSVFCFFADNEKDEQSNLDVLRQFDLELDYGPCIGKEIK